MRACRISLNSMKPEKHINRGVPKLSCCAYYCMLMLRLHEFTVLTFNNFNHYTVHISTYSEYLAGQGFMLHSRVIVLGFVMSSQNLSSTTPLLLSLQSAYELCFPPPHVAVQRDQSENTQEYSGARPISFFGNVYS